MSYQNNENKTTVELCETITHKKHLFQKLPNTHMCSTTWNEWNAFCIASGKAGLYVGCFVLLCLIFLLFRTHNIVLTAFSSCIIYALFAQWFKKVFLRVLYEYKRKTVQIDIPDDMSAIDIFAQIETQFSHPAIETIFREDNALLLAGPKVAFKLVISETGLQIKMIACCAKKKKKQYLYAMLRNAVQSQVIAILYPEQINEMMVKRERRHISGAFRKDKYCFWRTLIALVAGLFVSIYLTVNVLGGVEMIQSSYISGSTHELFDTGATVGETLDHFFADGTWSTFNAGGISLVEYQGFAYNAITQEMVEISFCFKVDNLANTITVRYIWLENERLNSAEMTSLIAIINDNYTGASTNGIESFVRIEDVQNDEELEFAATA